MSTEMQQDGQQDCQQWQQEPPAITALQIVNILLRRRWMIIIGTIVVVAGTAGYSMMIDESYTASTIFLPSRTATMSNRMGAMVGMGGMVGAVEGTSENSSPEYFSALLQSPPFLERIFGGTGEAPLNFEQLAETISVTTGKSKSGGQQLLTLSVKASGAQSAADLANAALSEIVKYNVNNRNSKAASNKLFVEEQLIAAQVLLAESEKALADFSTRNRKIATPDLQTDKERLVRSVKTQEEVFITLTKQLELAKIQEHEDQETIEVIEVATPPLMRTSPNRRSMVTTAGFAGLFLFGFLALAREYFKNLNRDERDTKEFFKNLQGIKRDVGLGRVAKNG